MRERTLINKSDQHLAFCHCAEKEKSLIQKYFLFGSIGNRQRVVRYLAYVKAYVQVKLVNMYLKSFE